MSLLVSIDQMFHHLYLSSKSHVIDQTQSLRRWLPWGATFDNAALCYIMSVLFHLNTADFFTRIFHLKQIKILESHETTSYLDQ